MKERIIKLIDPTWGDIHACFIYESDDGSWSGEWERLRENAILEPLFSLFSRVSNAAYQDALAKYPMPLIKELGLSPEACLIKTPDEFLGCANKKTCAMYAEKTCLGDNPKVPTCYEAAIPGVEDTGLTLLVTRVLELWRLGFYIIVTPDHDL